MDFNWYLFSELSNRELYSMLALRCEVFIVEQKCPYLDIDGRDPSYVHLLGTLGKELVAYARLLPPSDQNDTVKFGRIVIKREVRSEGYGKKLLEEILIYSKKNFPRKSLECSAQLYLQKFYESFGFVVSSATYEEDGIPHIEMKRIS